MYDSEVRDIGKRLARILSKKDLSGAASAKDVLEVVESLGSTPVDTIGTEILNVAMIRALHESGRVKDLDALEAGLRALHPRWAYTLRSDERRAENLPAFALDSLRVYVNSLWLDTRRSIWDPSFLAESAQWSDLNDVHRRYAARDTVRRAVEFRNSLNRLRADGAERASLHLADLMCAAQPAESCPEARNTNNLSSPLDLGMRFTELRPDQWPVYQSDAQFVSDSVRHFCRIVFAEDYRKSVEAWVDLYCHKQIGWAVDLRRLPGKMDGEVIKSADYLILGGSALPGTQPMQIFRLHQGENKFFRTVNGHWEYDPSAPMLEFLSGPNDKTGYRKGRRLPISLILDKGDGEVLYLKRGVMHIESRK